MKTQEEKELNEERFDEEYRVKEIAEGKTHPVHHFHSGKISSTSESYDCQSAPKWNLKTPLNFPNGEDSLTPEEVRG
jgi:hypothetical protein